MATVELVVRGLVGLALVFARGDVDVAIAIEAVDGWFHRFNQRTKADEANSVQLKVGEVWRVTVQAIAALNSSVGRKHID